MSPLATPPALPDAFAYSADCPFVDFPPIEEYLGQAADISMDVDMDDPLIASDAPTPDFSSHPSPPPPPPSFAPTNDDWEAHMHDPALKNKYERGGFVHEVLDEDNLTFDPVEANAAYPSCPSSSTMYPYFSIPQLQRGETSSKEDFNLGVMLKLLKLFLEETAARPARVEDLNPLEFACIIELSEKFRGALPPSAAVAACAQACGL